MQARVFSNEARLGAAAAEDIDRRLIESTGRPFVLGCPGGRSPKPVYNALATFAAERQRDLSNLVIVMMDDYLVPSGSGYRRVEPGLHFSCERFAEVEIRAALNAGLPPKHRIPESAVWLPDPDDPGGYERRIEAIGGVDLFILACGASDGHIAFNPPGSARTDRTRIVALADSTRRDNRATFPEFTSLEQVPKWGVTVGPATIRDHSRATTMIVWGEGKREAFLRLSAAVGYEPDWPATILCECAQPTLLADLSAAGRS